MREKDKRMMKVSESVEGREGERGTWRGMYRGEDKRRTRDDTGNKRVMRAREYKVGRGRETHGKGTTERIG